MNKTYCPLVNGKCQKDCMFRLSEWTNIELNKRCQLFKVIENVEYLIDHDMLTDHHQHNDQ